MCRVLGGPLRSNGKGKPRTRTEHPDPSSKSPVSKTLKNVLNTIIEHALNKSGLIVTLNVRADHSGELRLDRASEQIQDFLGGKNFHVLIGEVNGRASLERLIVGSRVL